MQRRSPSGSSSLPCSGFLAGLFLVEKGRGRVLSSPDCRIRSLPFSTLLRKLRYLCHAVVTPLRLGFFSPSLAEDSPFHAGVRTLCRPSRRECRAQASPPRITPPSVVAPPSLSRDLSTSFSREYRGDSSPLWSPTILGYPPPSPGKYKRTPFYYQGR